LFHQSFKASSRQAAAEIEATPQRERRQKGREHQHQPSSIDAGDCMSSRFWLSCLPPLLSFPSLPHFSLSTLFIFPAHSSSSQQTKYGYGGHYFPPKRGTEPHPSIFHSIHIRNFHSHNFPLAEPKSLVAFSINSPHSSTQIRSGINPGIGARGKDANAGQILQICVQKLLTETGRFAPFVAQKSD
jgi:hypothetical protein